MWIVVWVPAFARMTLVGEEGSSEISEVKPFYMTIAVIKTKAEQQLAAEFERVAGTLPGGGWVPAMRQAAMGAFAGTGLPHRKIEAWKYTDLRALVKEVPPPVTAKTVSIDETALAAALGLELAKLPCNRLVFVDGAFVADASGPTPDLVTATRGGERGGAVRLAEPAGHAAGVVGGEAPSATVGQPRPRGAETASSPLSLRALAGPCPGPGRSRGGRWQ